MIKNKDLYSPCTNCYAKRKYGWTRCPFDKKPNCSAYKMCEALEAMDNNTDSLDSIPVELFVRVLRHHGYSGELRKTCVINI